MADSPDLLFVTPVTPATEGNGLAMRAGLFLEGLARSHSVRVVVVPVFGRPENPGDFVDEHAADFLALDLGSARAAEEITDAAANCTAVHVMRLYLAPFVSALLDRLERPPMVLDLDDVESTTRRSLGLGSDAERYDGLEARYLPLFDRVLTASPRDARSVARRLGLTAVQAVPNAVRPSRLPTEPGGAHDLLFVGNLSYPPNAEAARWLCREVLPLIGDATVAVVGSRPVPEVRALADDDRVTVAADVAELGAWYAGARVATAPLHSGGGTPIKVLEAFIHGRPVVTTSRVAEGLDLDRADGPALIADEPEEFAAACRRLLEDPELASLLAGRGVEFVEASATVEVVADTIDRLFGSIRLDDEQALQSR